MTQIEEDDIILSAAIEFGADYIYEIKNGSLGITLFVHVNSKEEAAALRADLPTAYEGVRTIVTYCSAEKPNKKRDDMPG